VTEQVGSLMRDLPSAHHLNEFQLDRVVVEALALAIKS
jgi:hypothetical protein